MTKQELIAKQELEAKNGQKPGACEWITVDELRAKLKISRATVYRWINNGALHAYRLKNSRNIYFLNAEVDHFLSLNPIAPSGRLDKLALSLHSTQTS